MTFRELAAVATTLMSRSRFGTNDGITFNGNRNMYDALGYNRVITPQQYRSRYRRGGIAGRLVEVKPQDTWRGGFDLVEDPDVKKDTPFELAWEALNEKFKVTSVLQCTDILAGIGHYAVIMIGAPGLLQEPLDRMPPNDLKYLSTFAEDDATIAEFDIDTASPRFGLPLFYDVKRTTMTGRTAINSATVGKRVHWTRIIHVGDGLLDDKVYGTPRLERVWNLLDDLEKVTGGGAEAFWKRADMGRQFDIDPTMDLGEDEIAALDTQLEDYKHGLKKELRTRGMKITTLGSDVANFDPQSTAIIAQICASVGIPQRVLMGSEQAKLAAEQDSVKYYRSIEARRADFAGPQVVRQLIDRLITLGTLPAPKSYDVSWSQIKTMDDDEKVSLAKKMADVNSTQGETVITVAEIRENALGYDPIVPADQVKKDIPPAQAALERALASADVDAVEHLLTRALRDDRPNVVIEQPPAAAPAPATPQAPQAPQVINVHVESKRVAKRRIIRENGLITQIVEDESAT